MHGDKTQQGLCPHFLAYCLSHCPYQFKAVGHSEMNGEASVKPTYTNRCDYWGLIPAFVELSLSKTVSLLYLSLNDKRQTFLDLHKLGTFSLIFSSCLHSGAVQHPKKEASLSTESRVRVINAEIPKKGWGPPLLNRYNRLVSTLWNNDAKNVLNLFAEYTNSWHLSWFHKKKKHKSSVFSCLAKWLTLYQRFWLCSYRHRFWREINQLNPIMGTISLTEKADHL